MALPHILEAEKALGDFLGPQTYTGAQGFLDRLTDGMDTAISSRRPSTFGLLQWARIQESASLLAACPAWRGFREELQTLSDTIAESFDIPRVGEFEVIADPAMDFADEVLRALAR